MDAYQERVLQSFRRVQGWFGANPQYVADNPSLGKQVETLNGIVSRLSAHATAQDTQRAQSLLISKDETEKRRQLVAHEMAPIAKVARALSGTIPGIGVLSMPKSKVSSPELLVAASAMAEKAEIYKDVLVESGLPADFIEQLQEATAALKSSIDGRGLARASRVAATQGVGNELGLGRRVIAILDVVVTRLIRTDPPKVAEWQQLKRVTQKLGGAHSSAVPVETQSDTVATSSNSVETTANAVETSANAVVARPELVVKAA